MGRRTDRTEMILVVVHRICHRILRISLPMAVIVDYQISGQTHQPVCEVALFGVVLIQSSIDPDEYFLRKILCRIGVRCESIGEVEDPAGKESNYLFPRDAITAACTPHKISTIYFRRRL